ncbi:MAG TPA: TetR/AcrR family transcriptional regulator [Myxococcaceae bacterium]|nr:TetR/AcrR family transcriptional regulator [Myxococcaceae bacterium]
MARHRKTPRPRDASATREALLDAATLVFAGQGFAGARVDEIAARAGVNKALIYAYYGDKTGIYRAVLTAHLHEFADPAFSKAFAAEAGPRRALEDIVRRWFRLLIRDRPFARLLAWDLLSNGKGGRDIILESSGPMLELISELVDRGRATGELRASADPELFRSVLFSIGLGYVLQHSAMTLARERSGQSRTDEQFVEYLCRMLLAPECEPERRTA